MNATKDTAPENPNEDAIPTWTKNLQIRAATLGKKQIDFCREYGYDKSTVSRWFNGRQEPRQHAKNKLCEFLNIPSWSWLLSKEEQLWLEQEEELKLILSERGAYMDITGSGMSLDAYDTVRETFHLLLIFGFQDVINRYKKNGEIAKIAPLITVLTMAIRGLYQSLEPSLESYCNEYQGIRAKHSEPSRPLEFPSDLETLEALRNVGIEHSFALTGEFDGIGNIKFNLYERHKEKP